MIQKKSFLAIDHISVHGVTSLFAKINPLSGSLTQIDRIRGPSDLYVIQSR